MAKHRILFLCMGNICRSPAAHCVFQHMVEEAGLTQDFEIDSAGTIGFHEGSPPDRRMQVAMRAREIPVIGRSRPLTPVDLREFDLILAMDHDNLADAQALTQDPTRRAKVKLFTEFCREHDLPEVPDPYYGGDKGFDHVLDMVEDGCAGLFEYLRKDA